MNTSASLSIFAVLVSAALCCACGGGQKQPTQSAAATTAPNPQTTAAKAEPKDLPLEAAWKTDCLLEKTYGKARRQYFIEQVSFTMAREFTHTRLEYKDKACKTLISSETISGTYEIGNPVKARDAFVGNWAASMGAKKTDATELNIVINSGENPGKYYSVYKISGKELILGYLTSESEDPPREERIPALIRSKPFKR